MIKRSNILRKTSKIKRTPQRSTQGGLQTASLAALMAFAHNGATIGVDKKETNGMREYLKLEDLVGLIDEPHRSACLNILSAHRLLFEQQRGSTHNHQTWDGGYIDHITDCMNYARHLYSQSLIVAERWDQIGPFFFATLSNANFLCIEARRVKPRVTKIGRLDDTFLIEVYRLDGDPEVILDQLNDCRARAQEHMAA